MLCSAARRGAVQCGAARRGAVRCGAVRCGAARCGLACTKELRGSWIYQSVELRIHELSILLQSVPNIT